MSGGTHTRGHMGRCPECGFDLEPDEDECPNCGAILADYEEFDELEE